MSDTMQGVQWVLEQGCGLRVGDAVGDMEAAAKAVSGAHSFGQLESRDDGTRWVFGDVCVTGYTGATLRKGDEAMPPMVAKLLGRPASRSAAYPASGYLVSEQFKDVGGVEKVREMCRGCVANTGRPALAGCVGWVGQRPWCHETEGHLRTVVSRLGLAGAIQERLLVTEPIWFGLWTKRVVTPKTAGLLATLMEALIQERGTGESQWRHSSWRGELEGLVAAARIAEEGKVKLQVKMSPPGHVDFGRHTIFAHCPRCKAEAEVERWKGKVPTAMCTCKVCGERYSPAEQASSERYDFVESPELRELLGEKFEALAREFLMHGGMTLAEAEETVKLTEADHVKRQARVAENTKARQAEERYVNESLHAGLTMQTLVDPGDTSRIIGKGFGAADFAQLLRRCAELGITVNGIFHRSVSDELKRDKLRSVLPGGEDHFEPLELFRQWQAEGCRELFGMYARVPENLVKAFEEGAE